MIELQNISKSFDGVSVLDNISTGIPDSGIFAICGASGSGKTTLMRIILGLEQPDSGNISGLEGKKTAVVFQNDRLLPWLSALDNVAAVCSKERAKEMLEKVELSDALNKARRAQRRNVPQGGVGACAGVRRGYSPARRTVQRAGHRAARADSEACRRLCKDEARHTHHPRPVGSVARQGKT